MKVSDLSGVYSGIVERGAKYLPTRQSTKRLFPEFVPLTGGEGETSLLSDCPILLEEALKVHFCSKFVRVATTSSSAHPDETGPTDERLVRRDLHGLSSSLMLPDELGEVCSLLGDE